MPQAREPVDRCREGVVGTAVLEDLHRPGHGVEHHGRVAPAWVGSVRRGHTSGFDLLGRGAGAAAGGLGPGADERGAALGVEAQVVGAGIGEGLGDAPRVALRVTELDAGAGVRARTARAPGTDAGRRLRPDRVAEVVAVVDAAVEQPAGLEGGDQAAGERRVVAAVVPGEAAEDDVVAALELVEVADLEVEREPLVVGAALGDGAVVAAGVVPGDLGPAAGELERGLGPGPPPGRARCDPRGRRRGPRSGRPAPARRCGTPRRSRRRRTRPTRGPSRARGDGGGPRAGSRGGLGGPTEHELVAPQASAARGHAFEAEAPAATEGQDLLGSGRPRTANHRPSRRRSRRRSMPRAASAAAGAWPAGSRRRR